MKPGEGKENGATGIGNTGQAFDVTSTLPGQRTKARDVVAEPQ